jgi:hypothetical protein
MSEPIIEAEVKLEETKPAKKAGKAKPVLEQSQTEKARAHALAKMKAAGR